MLPIELRGGRAHNLKGVDVTLVPGELVAVTGVSGAGKSSLALDTLYAEGQRRFVESFSPYARQFLERLDRPAMDRLEPIAAGIAVDRRSPIKSSRSNVATMADIEPYISALFACEAVPICPDCGVAAERTDPVIVAKRLAAGHRGRRAVVTYDVRVDGTEAFLDVREALLRDGYRRVFIGGETRELDELAPSVVMERGRGTLGVVVDRLKLDAADRQRLSASVAEAWRRGHDRAALHVEGEAEPIALAAGLTCPSCARAFAPPKPSMFSYQSPVGACPTCRGFGRTIGIDWSKVFPNENKSLAEGAIKAWSGKTSQYERKVLKKYCEAQGISMTAPWRELTASQKNAVIVGEGSWTKGRYPGVKAWFDWLETKTYKMHVRVLLSRYRAYDPCGACNGKRLSAASLAYRVAGLDLGEWHGLEIRDAVARLTKVDARSGQGQVARRELLSRLGYLDRVGLGYLTLDRQSRTLSGGEAQRVSLTAALGTSLVGALFVLDEPTVGLHPSDVPPLLTAMRDLAESGNVVLVVEHDPQVIASADRVLELGPHAGKDGGALVYDGPPSALYGRPDLATGRALSPQARLSSRKGRAIAAGPARGKAVAKEERALVIKNARGHNLKNVSVAVPLDRVVAITGASGSGKSSLVNDVLYKTIARHLGQGGDIEAPLPHDGLDGLSLVRDVAMVDQAPLGRTSRGNPATYTGAWNRVRALFAEAPEAVAASLGPSHFSFNVEGGRCDACTGEGAETVEMQFLADVSLTCAACGGKRFKPEVLAVRFRDKTVSDVLAMTVDEALAFFERDQTIVRSLGPLAKLGLGYLALGQPLSTLSGGEAQRLKLARALAETKKNKLFLFDEPSAGLHEDEVGYVAAALDALVQSGASVVMVEHDLSLIACADWVIELGPGAGSEGGQVVAEGTAEQIARGRTRTGEALRARVEGAAAARVAGAAREARGARPALPTGITIENAREHNLKEVSLTIPHGKLVVVTGPSGSGKSTLAFDVVFAEGQRRFMETLTPYARQFLPTLPRPNVDRVLGVPPAIALEQRTTRLGSTSTVATVTEIAQYLRLLFAKVGEVYCPTCDVRVEPSSPAAILARLRRLRGKQLLLAPAVEARKGTYLDVFAAAARSGVTHAVVDGTLIGIETPPRLKKTHEHTIELVTYEGSLAELSDTALSHALSLGRGAVRARRAPFDAAGESTYLSTRRACPSCGEAVPELDPRWFSFNTKQGQCASCEGSGLADAEDPSRGACKACGGSRLAPLPRAQRLAGERYHEVTAKSIDEARTWADRLRFENERALIAEAPQKELVRRLAFACDVGLGYLTLDRLAATLSGGEMQRLRLAAQLGSGLTGALYVLDEPTIGLHPRDTHLLLDNLRKLAEAGSSVLMVEHDADTIRAADWLIDLGPTGGRGGGRVLASGAPAQVLADPASLTGRALADERAIAARRVRRSEPVPKADMIVLSGARAHNLRLPRVEIPSGRLSVIAGVSGSGKSTLISRVLFPAVREALGLETPPPLAFDKLVLPPGITRALAVDQSPIGRTSRSVPATFLGIFDDIRRLFAATPEAKVRGFEPARFSFNTGGGGRCSGCDGQGVTSHEMSFLPDVKTVCEACGGARFEPSTLEVTYAGLSIGDVLDLSAEEALTVFKAHTKISRPLELMTELGIGYLKLGQGSHTLSGGEAQRLKLATELTATWRAKPTLYVLDEPTTGLHWSDVARLIAVLDKLVARGDTVVVIEHHPAVIASADWVIELGPEGGAAGGQLVAAGAPEEIATLDTATGQVLRELLGGSAPRKAAKKSTNTKAPRAPRQG